jgi:hypothetical protein
MIEPDKTWIPEEESYTITELMQGLGVSSAKIDGWLKCKWLKGTTPNALRLFVRDHPGEVDPSHVDWLWLVAILVGMPQEQVHAPRRKPRYLRGVPHPNAVKKKLCAEQVRAIRKRYADGETLTDLARAYGVTTTTIYTVVTYRSWKYVE